MLEQKLSENTAALVALTAAIGQLIAANGAPAPQAAPVVQPQVMPQAAPPQTFPPQQAMGMPPSPFPGAAPPQACPFADAAALQAWAYSKYQANPALMPAMEAIIKQHGLERMDLARPDQLPSLYAAINAL